MDGRQTDYNMYERNDPERRCHARKARKTNKAGRDLYGSFLGIGSGNGKRDSLAVLINAEDDELTGLSLIGYKRSFDLHLCNGRVKVLLVHNLVHTFILLFTSKK